MLFLQDAQQFALDFQGNFPNLVQEKGSALGCFKAAGAVLDRPGKGAFDVAKEFAFEEFFWNRSAVDPDQRAVFARTAPVDFARDKVLARAGFTEDEDRGFRRRHHVNLADKLAQGGALADEVAESFGCHHLLLQVGVLHFQLGLEPLYFFKGAGVGDGGANVIGKNPAPRPHFIRNVVAAKPCDHPQNLAFENDRRAAHGADIFSPHPFQSDHLAPGHIQICQYNLLRRRGHFSKQARAQGYPGFEIIKMRGGGAGSRQRRASCRHQVQAPALVRTLLSEPATGADVSLVNQPNL